MPSGQRHPTPLELTQRLLIADCSRAQQIAVVGMSQPHTRGPHHRISLAMVLPRRDARGS